jgi:hypothetical protein
MPVPGLNPPHAPWISAAPASPGLTAWDAPGPRHLPLKLFYQRRLPDARLPRHQHQPPITTPRISRVLGQRR